MNLEQKLEELKKRTAWLRKAADAARERQHKEGKMSAASGLNFCSTRARSRRPTSW